MPIWGFCSANEIRWIRRHYYRRKAKSPVWLKIKDDKVSLEKADFLWGKGTRATTEEICRLTSPETCVAAIGQAGENLVPLSGMLNSRNHSGGAGTGAIMGSKT